MNKRRVRFEDIDEEPEEGFGLKNIFNSLKATLTSYSKWAKTHSKTALSWGVTLGWYIATATIITAMPLLLELQREQAVIEIERIQVKDLLAQGYPPQELQRAGMTLEPSVLQEAQQAASQR